MYSPATSRTVTSPAGNDAARLNGAAIDSTGNDAASPVNPAFTASAWTKFTKSMIGTSSTTARAADIAAAEVPITELTYSMTVSCCDCTAAATAGSASTVLEFSTCEPEATSVHFCLPRFV